jgi:S-adenosylmethionine:tRNA ribosyltransferase-isomerase
LRSSRPPRWAVPPACSSATARPPLPPYILSARKASGHEADAERDAQRYQTVYADEPGSVAAPTAGLHFTPELLAALTSGGVGRTDVLLHVGSGTFKPVEAGVVEDHDMHAERCVMHERAVEAVRATREARGRVLAVGTTSARTLESYAAETERSGAVPSALDTRLLITPGYRWRWADGLLTNFHLPRSTLLAMVSSLFVRDGEDPGVGVPRLLAHYAHAIESGYRFYSFGDAMLVLP